MYFGLINYASTFSQWGGQTRNVLQNSKTKVSNSTGDILIEWPPIILLLFFELEKCILHGGWNANDSEVEPEPSFLQTVAFVVAGESIKPRFAQTFRANISIDVFYFARERNKVIFRIFELVTFKEYEDLKWKIQYWWFSTLPAHTWCLSFFLHGQIFWRIKFTPKNSNFLR